MHADAAMAPGDQHHHRLLHGAQAGAAPHLRQHVAIGGADAERLEGDDRAEDMSGQQQRHGQAEPELHRLPGLQPEAVAPPDRHQRIGEMDREGDREHGQAGLLLPHQDEQLEAALHHIERDQPGRVVDQMGRQKCEENQSARQPQLLQPCPGPVPREPGGAKAAQFSGPV